MRAQSELQIALDVRLPYEEGGMPLRHVPDIEAAVFRLVQEALTNVVKHAGATSVVIRIAEPDAGDGQLIVEIDDDGCGFDPDDSDGGFGLLGMRERVALVRGQLTVTSRSGEGTRLEASIPVQRQSEDPASRAPSASG